MLSRVADSLYWLGRYSERTETNAHIISTQIEHMLEQNRNDSDYEKEWHIVIDICGYIEQYKLVYDSYYFQQMVHYLLIDLSNYNSIQSLITNIRNNARNARNVIPNDLW